MHESTSKEQRDVRRFRPATDIVEMEDGFHIYMDLPGLKKEDLSIDLQESEITISGPTADTLPSEGKENLTHHEFPGGEYRRTFILSDTVYRERISAKLNNGVLDMYLPKSEKALPRKIEISAE